MAEMRVPDLEQMDERAAHEFLTELDGALGDARALLRTPYTRSSQNLPSKHSGE
jgi:hypothetical protein